MKRGTIVVLKEDEWTGGQRYSASSAGSWSSNNFGMRGYLNHPDYGKLYTIREHVVVIEGASVNHNRVKLVECVNSKYPHLYGTVEGSFPSRIFDIISEPDDYPEQNQEP